MDKFFILIPPSVMEDEGRYRLGWSVPFGSYSEAYDKVLELAAESKGWFRPASFIITEQVAP